MSTTSPDSNYANSEPQGIAYRRLETALGYVLLLAASFKADQLWLNRELFLPAIYDQPMLKMLLIEAELLFGLVLVFGTIPRARFALATTCFSAFAVFSVYETSYGVESCGCFGNLRVAPAITATFDILAVVSLFLLRPNINVLLVHVPSRIKLRIFLFAAVIGTSGLMILHTFDATRRASSAGPWNQGEGDLVVLRSSDWVQKPFQLFDEIDNSKVLRQGRWLIILYHYDCPNCLNAIAKYRALAEKDSGKPIYIAFVAVPPLPTLSNNPVPASPRYLSLSLHQDRQWFAVTPVVAEIDGGQVVTAAEGEKANNFSYPPQYP